MSDVLVVDLTPPAARLAVDALPAALAAYERAAAALRVARSDFAATLRTAGPAAEPLLRADATAEAVAGLARTIAGEAATAAAFASAHFDGLADEGRPLHDLYVLQARGQARVMLACTCGACDVCALITRALREGKDPIAELTAAVLRTLEPSGLVGTDGAPLAPLAPLSGAPNVVPLNRHQRRATAAQARRGAS